VSVLLLGLDPELMPVLIRRLTSEGDEVRVLERDEDPSGDWRSLGAHIASGPQWDADLIERAAQNVRTIVIGDRHEKDPAELMAALIEGGGHASRTMRLVFVGEPEPEPLKALREADLQFVILGSPTRRGLLGRKPSIGPQHLAEAIDAADDLAGSLRLELNLRDEQAWRKLMLEPPES
jgi:hypothetical protein